MVYFTPEDDNINRERVGVRSVYHLRYQQSADTDYRTMRNLTRTASDFPPPDALTANSAFLCAAFYRLAHKVCLLCGADSQDGCAENDCDNDWTNFWR